MSKWEPKGYDPLRIKEMVNISLCSKLQTKELPIKKFFNLKIKKKKLRKGSQDVEVGCAFKNRSLSQLFDLSQFQP